MMLTYLLATVENRMEECEVIYFNWGMVVKEAFGKKEILELGLGERARFHFDRGRVEKGFI